MDLLKLYLELEVVMVKIDLTDSIYSDDLRDIMDDIWNHMSDEEHDKINNSKIRTGNPLNFAGKI
jgi:hypothetical protein